MKNLIAACFFFLIGLNITLAVDYKISPVDFKNSQRTLVKSFSEYPMDFLTNIKVNSDTLGIQIWPAVAYDSERKIFHAVWYDNRNNFYYIYYSYSTDEGKTWSLNERVNDSDSAFFPCITLDDLGRPVVVWADCRNGGWDIYVSRREDNGWTEGIRINDDNIHQARNPNLFFKNGKFYAAWSDNRNGSLTDVYFSSSNDLKNWSQNIRVNDDLGYEPVASDPQIAVGNDNIIYIVFNGWEGNVPGGRYPDCYFTKSTDGGQTWMSPQVRMNLQTAWYQQDPDIAVDDKGWLYAVWEDDAEEFFDFNIRFACSTDGGLNWTNKIIDDDSNFGFRLYPMIIFNNGYLDAIWGYDNRNGRQDIYFTLSKNQGQDWSPNQIVNNNQSMVNGGVQMAGNNLGDVYCVWHEYHGDNNILYEIFSSKGRLKPTGIEFNRPNDKISQMVKIYPNPVRQKTTISYSLTKAANLRIAIYDLNGRLRAVLLDKNQSAGQHSFVYQPKDLPNGIYILKIKIDNREIIEKIILLKQK